MHVNVQHTYSRLTLVYTGVPSAQGSELLFAMCIGYTFRATPLNVLYHSTLVHPHIAYILPTVHTYTLPTTGQLDLLTHSVSALYTY